MPIYYLDTSVIIKLYVNEPRTEVMIRLLDEIDSDDRLYTSWFTILELTSVILRLAKGGRLGTNTADSIVAGFQHQIGETFLVWPIDESVLTEALAVVERHTLRSPDAIHLATAMSIYQLTPELDKVLVTGNCWQRALNPAWKYWTRYTPPRDLVSLSSSEQIWSAAE